MKNNLKQRRKYLIRLKKGMKHESQSTSSVIRSVLFLQTLIGTPDLLEWTLLKQEEPKFEEFLKDVVIVMLYARKHGHQEVYLYLDKLFAIYYHVYVYNRSVTHPEVRKLIFECKKEVQALDIFLNKVKHAENKLNIA